MPLQDRDNNVRWSNTFTTLFSHNSCFQDSGCHLDQLLSDAWQWYHTEPRAFPTFLSTATACPPQPFPFPNSPSHSSSSSCSEFCFHQHRALCLSTLEEKLPCSVFVNSKIRLGPYYWGYRGIKFWLCELFHNSVTLSKSSFWTFIKISLFLFICLISCVS